MTYKIFKTGLYDYSDDPRVNVTKPVLYTPRFFEEMIKEIDEVPLDTKHDGVNIGSLNDITFEDDYLLSNVNTEMSLEGKGISPVFRYDTIDRGDYLEAVNGEFTSAGITDTPRNNIIFNSYTESNKKGENMVSEEAFEQLSKQNRKLERELATKENQLEANKSKLEKLSELEKENKTLREERDKSNSELEKIRPLADKFNEYESKKKEELVNEIAGEDSGLKEKIKEWDISQLELLNSHRTVTTEPRGVPSGSAEGIDEGDGKKNKSEYDIDKFKEDFKAVMGEEPKYA